MSRDSDDAKKLINWRKGGSKVAGESAGNFSAVAGEVLQRRQNSVSGGLTIGELNELLDRLAAAEGRQAKTGVLGELIRRTNWQEMKWIIMIILKELKLGISEKTVFHEFHVDAEDLFNVTCDLRFVCEKLCDRNVRHKRQDIEVGKAVRPQLAFRAPNFGEALKKIHGKEVVVECKFDGDRIQVHKNGNNVCYFSRNFINHEEFEPGMNSVIVDNVLVDRCILDGEMLVWDTGSNRFADFGTIQEVAKAAKEGLDIDKKLCYVAFDVLYVGDTSVIHRSLKERQELLRKVVRPMKGRLEVLLPSGNESLNAHRVAGEPCWSIVVKHVDDVERFFKEMIDSREEGIVLKDLGSKWEPGDRSAKWVKLKPDYGRGGADLDVLIIGGYYGTGRRGGEIGQFLVGLAERPSPNTYPRKFLSFCKVGTGLSDEELNELVTKLKPYLRKYEYPKKSPPSFYQVTNHSGERPDVWVESPEKSFIVSITSDVRTISTDVYAAPYGLRFARIDRVRYDKPWHECLDVQSFVELVQSSNGTIHRGGDNDGAAVGKPKRGRTGKGEGRKKLALTVPSHFARTDVSSVKGESRVFSKMVFHFVNVPANHSSDSLHTLVVENGGTFSMNLNDTVTHCVGAESKGIKYEAAKRRGRDVIHYSWVLDCCSKKQLLPLRPNHFLYLSDVSRNKLQEEIDEFSDSYFWDINVAELKQILSDVNKSKDAKVVDYYKKKYCPREKWCCFHGSRVYFHLVDKFPSSDWEVFLRVAMKRMKVEVSVGGGKVVDNPSEATHIVVVSLPGHELNFETLLQGFPEDKRRLLRLRRIHVVRYQWLDDCLEKGQKLPEVEYSLKLGTVEESSSSDEEGENCVNLDRRSASPVHEEPVPSKALVQTKEPRRKRGRPAASKPVSKPSVPKRARVGKRPAKLQEIASDDETSEQEHHVQPRASPELDLIEPPRRKRAVKSREVASDEESSERDPLVQPTSSHEFDSIKPQRPKRARGRKGPAKLQEIASDDDINEQDHRVQPRVIPELDTTLQKRAPETYSNVIESTPVTSERNTGFKGEKPKFGLDNIKQDLDNAAGLSTCSGVDTDAGFPTSEKLEACVDPVQTMLLTMIPTLNKTADASNPVVEDKNLPPKAPKEGTSAVPKGESVKKKKVSYRDLVNQLLKN
ncbi:hypothetical protein RND81_04G241200 [Saponaria officinalis]